MRCAVRREKKRKEQSTPAKHFLISDSLFPHSFSILKKSFKKFSASGVHSTAAQNEQLSITAHQKNRVLIFALIPEDPDEVASEPQPSRVTRPRGRDGSPHRSKSTTRRTNVDKSCAEKEQRAAGVAAREATREGLHKISNPRTMQKMMIAIPDRLCWAAHHFPRPVAPITR